MPRVIVGLTACCLSLVVLASFASSVLMAAEGVPAPPHTPQVPSVERLTYSITWMGIQAATAVMEVEEAPPLQNRPVLRLLTDAKSSPMVTKFYPVHNRVESIIDAETLLPHRLLFQRREGKRKNDFDVTFNHKEGNVVSIKDGVPTTIPIPPGTQDTISCLYAVRHLPNLSPGSSQMMTVHHDKKNYKLEVRVERIEKVKGPWGEVEAVRVLAVMPFQGIFLNEGNVRVWFTNDARRIPIKMKAKVVIGSIVGEVVEGFQAPSQHASK